MKTFTCQNVLGSVYTFWVVAPVSWQSFRKKWEFVSGLDNCLCEGIEVSMTGRPLSGWEHSQGRGQPQRTEFLGPPPLRGGNPCAPGAESWRRTHHREGGGLRSWTTSENKHFQVVQEVWLRANYASNFHASSNSIQFHKSIPVGMRWLLGIVICLSVIINAELG